MPIYYNLSLKNTTADVIPLRFEESLNIAFLDNPAEYDVSIVRFVLPNFEIPFLTYKDTYTLPDGTDKSIYDMTMSYDGHSVTQHVAYIPSTTISGDMGIWDIQQCISMLNATIGTLYTALNAIVTLPTSDMPYFSYTEETQLMSFTANKNYFASDLAKPIVISFDQALLSWLYGFPSFGRLPSSIGVPTLYDMTVKDTKNNTVSTNYYVMKQQAPSFDRMRDFERIVITTNLPIANEYISSSTVLPIIQDYCPSDVSVSTFYNNIVYNATVPYRQTRLISNAPFYSVKFDCYSMSTDGTLRPLTLEPNNSANIKLMFTEHERNNYA